MFQGKFNLLVPRPAEAHPCARGAENRSGPVGEESSSRRLRAACENFPTASRPHLGARKAGKRRLSLLLRM